MKIKKSMIITGKQKDSRALQRATSTLQRGKDIERSDLQSELTRLLNESGLSVQDIISKYKYIYDAKIKSVKAGDVIKVLERIEHLHGLHAKHETEDSYTLTLSAKSADELESMLSNTLENTKRVIARMQARRINRESRE